MTDLRTAITVVEIIVGVAACIVLGDYLGYKFGHRKIAEYTLFIFLALVILFAIYAAIYFIIH
jgi:hypothetical protein